MGMFLYDSSRVRDAQTANLSQECCRALPQLRPQTYAFMQQKLTQMVPAFRPLEIVVAILRLLVKTPAASPYSVSFARSCKGGQLSFIHRFCRSRTRSLPILHKSLILPHAYLLYAQC